MSVTAPALSPCLGWSIVAVAFVADALSLGGRALFGVVMLFWNAEFGMSTAELSSLMALVHIAQGVATPLSGHAADRLPGDVVVGGGIAFLALCFGLTSLLAAKWQVWVVYGILAGLGYGLLNLNVFSVAVTRALPAKHEGLGVGIATAGSTFGQLALTPLFAHAAQTWGWRYGYSVLCGCTVALLVPAFVLLRKSRLRLEPQRRQIAESDRGGGEDIVTDRRSTAKLCRLIKSWPYIALTVAFFICGITTTGFIETHMISLAVHRNFDISTGAAAFAVLSGCNGVGMIVAGWLTDRYSRTILLSLIFFGRALCYLLLLVVDPHDTSGLFVFAVFFGFCDYSVVPPVVSLVGTHAGKDSVGLGVGILLAWHSLGGALGSVLGGTMFDPSTGYSGALWCCSILCVVAGAACLTICPEPLIRRTPTDPTDGESAVSAVPTKSPPPVSALHHADVRDLIVF